MSSGPSEGSKAREVLMTIEELEDMYERENVPVVNEAV